MHSFHMQPLFKSRGMSCRWSFLRVLPHTLALVAKALLQTLLLLFLMLLWLPSPDVLLLQVWLFFSPWCPITLCWATQVWLLEGLQAPTHTRGGMQDLRLFAHGMPGLRRRHVLIDAQVPPAIPTLPLCWLAAKWHRAAFVIDWHNFAYTLMALSMPRRHPLVRLRHKPPLTSCLLACYGGLQGLHCCAWGRQPDTLWTFPGCRTLRSCDL
jgi:hypothetical protein